MIRNAPKKLLLYTVYGQVGGYISIGVSINLVSSGQYVCTLSNNVMRSNPKQFIIQNAVVK